MRKDGWRCALWYFIRQAERYVLTAAALGVAMSAYIWLIQGDNIQELLHTIPNTVIGVAFIILFTTGISSAGYYYSTPISFGCLRKHAFLGNLLMNDLIITECLLLYWLMGSLMRIQQPYIVCIIAFFLMVEGISKFIGIVCMKWGKAVYIAITIGVAFIYGAIGFAVFYRGAFEKIRFVMYIDGKGMQAIQWIVLAVGSMISAAANMGSWREIRKFEVRT